MKTRNGFVSNSSSSSFIVLMKESDNDKFKVVPEGMTAKQLYKRCVDSDYSEDFEFPHLTDEDMLVFDSLVLEGYVKYAEASVDWGGEEGINELVELLGAKMFWGQM